jgi:hypothetical protein
MKTIMLIFSMALLAINGQAYAQTEHHANKNNLNKSDKYPPK